MNSARSTVEQFYKAFEAGDFDQAISLFHPDIVHRNPAGPQTLPEHRGYGEAFKTALPDARMEIERWVGDGDEVIALGRFRGTHSGPLSGPQGEIPPSGNQIDIQFADFFAVRDGSIVEHWTYFDQLAMFTALGAMG